MLMGIKLSSFRLYMYDRSFVHSYFRFIKVLVKVFKWCISQGVFIPWVVVIHIRTLVSLSLGGGGGNKTVHRQDNSPTRFLKTVYRQI